MNFAKRTHDVVCGRITQYRTPVVYSAPVEHITGGSTAAGVAGGRREARRIQRPAPQKVGDTIVVRAETRHEDGSKTPAVHASVLSVRREWLGAIDFAGAQAEGYRTTDDFRVAWVMRSLPAREQRWARHGADPDLLRPLLLARFARRYAAIEVWVVSFRLSDARDRFLAAGSRGGDYTTTAARALDADAPVVDDLFLARCSKAAEAHRVSFAAALEAERAERKATRGRSMRDAA